MVKAGSAVLEYTLSLWCDLSQATRIDFAAPIRALICSTPTRTRCSIRSWEASSIPAGWEQDIAAPASGKE